ncbi:ABC transporter ATP-binding protein [Roseovarius sp. SCSIO 43702]|uniref:ABC transporter ATP-binding protein n=1 Tax=Roseovarius sp. SCSIO 43702 TaxID=2823043 RepID=UPI001C7300CF|nr:ABC transporter ATP-binding protein [Roseovarius sp. SCSIO 43702]QYX56774.1 ABC transporter ATP-binding protein [Roseovarius sp. SCSIO 43702]
MIEIKGVSKVFGSGADAFRALDNVSVTVRQNEFFTLLGPSGCGKTTLLRLIAGFEGPTQGAITLDGADLAGQPPYKRPVNTVFQSYALFPHMTVAENVGFGLKMLGNSKADIEKIVGEMLELVRMSHLADRQTAQISGGQQQRVALARALAPRPKVLLLDEPLSALDFKLRKEMQLELKRLQSETGITFVFVTHDQEEALTMSDRIAVMSEGQIRQIGGPREIYDHPAERFVADFIGDTNFLPVEMIEAREDTARVRLPSGQEIETRSSRTDDAKGQVTLAIRPEHADLVTPGEGQLSGILEQIVYFGTDTHFHVTIDGAATPFVLRKQNEPDADQTLREGDKVGIRFGRNAGQVLKD